MIAGQSQQFSEEEAIRVLIATDEQFKRVYDSERPKVRKPVVWVLDRSLPDGLWGRNTTTDRAHFLRFPILPIPETEGQNVAHELIHLVVDGEGFPGIGYKNRQLENLAAALSSAFHDPLVHLRLEDYGYDLSPELHDELAKFERELGRFCTPLPPPSNQVDRLHWTFNFLQQIIEWDRQTRGSPASDNDVLAWIALQYPGMFMEAVALEKMSKRYGYDTPEKLQRLFVAILNRYAMLKPHLIVT